jgi:hypothetical protein
MKRSLKSLLILVIAALAVSGAADNVSREYADDALKRALATFAVARTLNGVISVAQGTEVAVEPGGVGVVMTPGQILDPINDLVERFSSVMLVAASSLGLQIVLLEILSWAVLTGLLVAALAVWLATLWSGRLQAQGWTAVVIRLSLILTFIRFAVPVVIMCTNFIFSTFLLGKHEASAAQLQGTTHEIEALNVGYDDADAAADAAGDDVATAAGAGEPGDAADTGLGSRVMDSALEWYAGVTNSAQDWYAGVSRWLNSMSISARMAQLKESASNATTHIVNLIVVFVLQTILFPLGFLWLFVELLKSVAARSVAALSGDTTRPPPGAPGASE